MTKKEGKKKLKHIAIAGNIGSGKTTLTEMLSKHFKWIPQFENIDENPYLYDFYQDMARWSFNVQIYFLNFRLKQLIDIQKGTATIIQDRTVYEDVFIFAACLKELKLLSERDYNTYFQVYNTFQQVVNPPDLLIYLKSSVPNLVDQIQKRGREYEENIRLDYLKRLNNHYDEWIKDYKHSKVLIINVDEVKFMDNKKHFNSLVQQINKAIG